MVPFGGEKQKIPALMDVHRKVYGMKFLFGTASNQCTTGLIRTFWQKFT